jgi:lysophospholipase L1-like esterase
MIARLAGAIALLLCAATVAHAQAPSCRFPDDLALTDQHLPAVHAALADHQPLTILAIGGAATAGVAAKGEAFTFPSRLAAHLRRLLPGQGVTVINRGVPGRSSRLRVEALAPELARLKPTLVIWAPGASEAGQSDDLAPFEDSLNEGIALIRAQHADLILIDLQYAPSIARIIDLNRYNGVIAGVAEAEGVPLLRRSDLMRYWNDNGVIDLEGGGAKDWTAISRRLFDCLAAGLADTVATAAP